MGTLPENGQDAPVKQQTAAAPSSQEKWRIKNETPRYMLLRATAATLELPPLATRVISAEQHEKLSGPLEKLVELNAIRCDPILAHDEQDYPIFSLGCGVWVLVGFGLLLLVSNLTSVDLLQQVMNSAGFVVLALLVLFVTIDIGRYVYQRSDTSWSSLLTSFVRSILRLINILVVVALVVLITGGLIYAFRGEAEAVQETVPAFFASPVGMARLLQALFIVIASLLPALMYFLFRRRRIETVEQRFLEDMLRLDPDVWTIADARAKYEPLFEETYGGSGSNFLLGSGLPIVLATLLILLGWILVLLPFGPIDDPLPASFDRLFVPGQTVVNFAFLGAYYFAVGMAFRRYVRADLTPKAYTQMILRLLLALILGWILATMGVFLDTESGLLATTGATLLYALVFLVAIFPDTGLLLIRETLRSRLGGSLPGVTAEEHPLTQLEGVNIYDQARLLEEGIENVANLAHNDLPALILNTRLPTERVIDLFDQAILYLHLGLKSEEVDMRRKRLLTYGIRTATDLERAYQGARSPTGNEAGRAATIALDEFLAILDDWDGLAAADSEMDDGRTKRPYRLAVLLKVMQDDDWMPHLRKWRRLEEEMMEWIIVSQADIDQGRHLSVMPASYLPVSP